MMDAPVHSTMQELIDIAKDRKGWRSLVNELIFCEDSDSESDSEGLVDSEFYDCMES